MPHVCHHASRRPLALSDLRIGGSERSGPAQLGLWCLSEPAAWQSAYGGNMAKITLREDARVLESTTRELCARAGSNAGAAWRSLASALRADYDVVMMPSGPDEPTEFVILDPAAIHSIEHAAPAMACP